mgnify:CR=1 FL=1|tara:strand:- start:541 stop:855 length:315 start_codon:yes stop_codon:yes gene_type:complete
MNNLSENEGEEINHTSFVFYESFYVSMKNLTVEEKDEYLSSICNYALYKKINNLSPKIEGMFALVKPQLDANFRKRKNGKLGGRPRKKETIDDSYSEIYQRLKG